MENRLNVFDSSSSLLVFAFCVCGLVETNTDLIKLMIHKINDISSFRAIAFYYACGIYRVRRFSLLCTYWALSRFSNDYYFLVGSYMTTISPVKVNSKVFNFLKIIWEKKHCHWVWVERSAEKRVSWNIRRKMTLRIDLRCADGNVRNHSTAVHSVHCTQFRRIANVKCKRESVLLWIKWIDD